MYYSAASGSSDSLALMLAMRPRLRFGGDRRFRDLGVPFRQQQQQKPARDQKGDDGDQDRQKIRRERRRLRGRGAWKERKPRHRGIVHAGDGKAEYGGGERQRI